MSAVSRVRCWGWNRWCRHVSANVRLDGIACGVSVNGEGSGGVGELPLGTKAGDCVNESRLGYAKTKKPTNSSLIAVKWTSRAHIDPICCSEPRANTGVTLPTICTLICTSMPCYALRLRSALVSCAFDLSYAFRHDSLQLTSFT